MKEKRKRNKKRRRIVAAIALPLLALPLLFVGGAAVYLAATIDPAADAALFEASRGSRTTRLYYNADRGSEVYVAREWESERILGAENAIWTEYSEIPENLKAAFLAVEDHRFFRHDGVDWYRTGKAALNQLFHFDSRFGGSSITQQLIKNMSGDDEQTARRKLREMARAVALERRFTKEEILELYLNIVPMGENSVGVGAGAERYFGKALCELTDAECATLAAIINAPARYDPLRFPTANRVRRDTILGLMHEHGMLTEEAYLAALREEPALCRSARTDPRAVHSWYTETVIEDVLHDLCEVAGYSRATALRLVFGGGLEIYTLADPTVQTAMEKTFCRLSTSGGVQYAGVVIDPKSGDLLGIVGGAGEKGGNRLFNHATSPHTPGSALKPLSVYAPALDSGLITSASVVDDVPVDFIGKELRPWPKNSPEIYHGLVDIGTAIATSKNTVSVKILRLLGRERSYSVLANTLGITTLVRRETTDNGNILTDLGDAPLALGQLTHGVSVRELASAYTPLSGDGTYKKGRTYLAVYDKNGKLLLANEGESRRAFSHDTASIMTKLLEGVVEGGTANGVYLPGHIPVAGKTGTSTEGRDKWFVGYSPYYLFGVWCGTEDANASIGGKPQLAIFNAVMGELHRPIAEGGDALTEFPLSPGVHPCRFCRDGGGLLTFDCLQDPRGDRSTLGWFTGATLPRTPCGCHVGVLCAEDGGVVAELNGASLSAASDEEIPLVRRSLVRVLDRRFPRAVSVLDAQYVYRPLGNAAPSGSPKEPYFMTTVPPGEHIGLSPTVDGRQFNAAYVTRPPEGEPLLPDPLGLFPLSPTIG